MSPGIVIEAIALTKSFRAWSPQTRTLKAFLSHPLQKASKAPPVVVLESLSFKIFEGDFVGIMGRNGVGKSTLLKLISGVYAPNSGQILVRREIAPLIELGAGFHPDLSGYENIFLNAAVLGVGRAAAHKALPAILDFSELGDRIHMPVKHFSSGMLVRLGFAIAAHLEKPILLIDEILAVGDLSFQRKCIAKIHELHAKGTTIVLVTHDPGSVEAHCTRCLILEKTHVAFDGPAQDGAERYRQLMA